MKNKTLIAVLFGSVAACVVAQQFEISRYTIDSGGIMRSQGGSFELSGTIGQPDADMLAGGGFQLTGGFWFELVPGDCDEDGMVHLLDHGSFSECMDGPGGTPVSGCECFDVDRSGAIDLRDFAVMSNHPTPR